MSITLSNPLTRDFSSPRFGFPQGLGGRGNIPAPIAICVHVLNTTLAEYIAETRDAIPYSAIRANTHASVHYVVAHDGAIWNLIRDTDTAWGLTGLNNPTWNVIAGYPSAQPDQLLLHVGIERADITGIAYAALAELLAYLCEQFSIVADETYIISHAALDVRFETCADALLPNLIGTVQALLVSGGIVPAPNVYVLAQNIAALQTQADTLAAQIAILQSNETADDAAIQTLQTNFTALQTQVNTLAATLASVTGTVTALAAHPNAIASLTALGHIKASDTILVDADTGVASVKQIAAAYVRDETIANQAVTANAYIAVNASIQVFDPSALVVTGPAWRARLTQSGFYRFTAYVELTNVAWEGNKRIELWLYLNNSSYRKFGLTTTERDEGKRRYAVNGSIAFYYAGGAALDVQCRIWENDTSIASPLKYINNCRLEIEKIGS